MQLVSIHTSFRSGWSRLEAAEAQPWGLAVMSTSGYVEGFKGHLLQVFVQYRLHLFVLKPRWIDREIVCFLTSSINPQYLNRMCQNRSNRIIIRMKNHLNVKEVYSFFL